MNVFMPYPDLSKSVSCLDDRRLGNQVYRECLTLINGGWPHHPCSKIWSNHKRALALYAIAGLDELARRGRHYPKWRDVFGKYVETEVDTGMPQIVLTEAFNISHQSNLIRKDAAHYGPMFPGVPSDLPYVWA